MLKDRLEEEKKSRRKLVSEVGGCRFCGQTEAVEVPPEWTEDEVDELVTERCECWEAESYARRKRRKEQAHERIDLLFGEGENKESEPIQGKALELLHDAVEKAGDEDIVSATIDTGNGIKAAIKLTDKGTIKVTRTQTKKNSYEV